MSQPNFRHEARHSVERARAHLAKGQVDDLRYAALELRMAMEALTYDRAQAYAAEMPPTEYDTWQPKKLLQQLLEIDPYADKDSTISFGLEPAYGVPPDVMQSLGSEKVLNLRTLKKHYDALGNHLHMPTLRQLANGEPIDLDRLAKRCADIVAFIDAVLDSTVFNSTLGVFTTMPCQRCNAVVRKRIPAAARSVTATCFECSATYTIEDGEPGNSLWRPNQVEVRCANEACGERVFIWSDELVPGNRWRCHACSSKNVICLGTIIERPMNDKDDASSA